jgi:hypothetical protein
MNKIKIMFASGGQGALLKNRPCSIWTPVKLLIALRAAGLLSFED